MPDLPQTRRSLIIRLRDRHDGAWVEFVAIYEKAIREYVRRKGLQEADALDVTQDVLAAVEAKLPSWDTDPSKGRFRGWLFRVARNITVDKILERSKSPKTGGNHVAIEVANMIDNRSQESAEFRKNYQRQLFHWAAERVRPRVSDKSWRAFWMTAMEGRGAADVATELKLAVGNVYSAKFRVTARIRELVEQFGVDDESNGGFDHDFET